MLAHASACRPNECCGLVAMDPIGEIRFVYPLDNAMPSPTAYTIEPGQALGAFLHAERSGWRIGGVFHSHPGGSARLSQRDLEEAADPRWLHFLIVDDAITCFRIAGQVAVPVNLS